LDQKKSLLQRMKKQAITLSMKYLASARGLAALDKIIGTKQQTDQRLAKIYSLANLPSLTDKAQVEQAISSQLRRIKNLAENLVELEHVIAKLENSLSQSVTQGSAPRPAPGAEKPIRQPAKPRGGKNKRISPIKPKPLGAAKKGSKLVPTKSLLDLNWKKPPKPKK